MSFQGTLIMLFRGPHFGNHYWRDLEKDSKRYLLVWTKTRMSFPLRDASQAFDLCFRFLLIMTISHPSQSLELLYIVFRYNILKPYIWDKNNLVTILKCPVLVFNIVIINFFPYSKKEIQLSVDYSSSLVHLFSKGQLAMLKFRELFGAPKKILELLS